MYSNKAQELREKNSNREFKVGDRVKHLLPPPVYDDDDYFKQYFVVKKTYGTPQVIEVVGELSDVTSYFYSWSCELAERRFNPDDKEYKELFI